MLSSRFSHGEADFSKTGSSPEQLAATVRKEMETSGKLIRTLGIRAD
jgi:hypothetical protein